MLFPFDLSSQNTEGTPRVSANLCSLHFERIRTGVGTMVESGRPSILRLRLRLHDAGSCSRPRTRAYPRHTRAAIAPAKARTPRSNLSPCHAHAERSRSHHDFSRASSTDLLPAFGVFAVAQAKERVSRGIGRRSDAAMGGCKVRVATSQHQRAAGQSIGSVHFKPCQSSECACR